LLDAWFAGRVDLVMAIASIAAIAQSEPAEPAGFLTHRKHDRERAELLGLFEQAHLNRRIE
jgi:hypothetical protein